jgi:hypothetical protein
MSTVQYRVAFGKKDEVVEGPDDATVVVSVAAADSAAAALDPAVAFMRGKLLKSGEIGPVLQRLGTR